jgi:hypothetical protein
MWRKWLNWFPRLDCDFLWRQQFLVHPSRNHLTIDSSGFFEVYHFLTLNPLLIMCIFNNCACHVILLGDRLLNFEMILNRRMIFCQRSRNIINIFREKFISTMRVHRPLQFLLLNIWWSPRYRLCEFRIFGIHFQREFFIQAHFLFKDREWLRYRLLIEYIS